MNDRLFSDAEAHGLWASQLRDMAEEKSEAGLTAEARELQRQAQVHQLQAHRAVRRSGIERDL